MFHSALPKQWCFQVLIEKCAQVHGLLQHVWGYDHERGTKASLELEAKETQILAELGWKGKSLVTKAHDGSPIAAKGNKPASRYLRFNFLFLPSMPLPPPLPFYF